MQATYNHSNNQKRLTMILFIFFIVMLEIFNTVFAQSGPGGGGAASKFFQDIQSYMLAWGVVVLGIAICWCGYEFFWGASNVAKVLKIAFGGVLIAAGPKLAQALFNALQ